LDAINSDFEGYERYYGEALVNENRFEEALDVAKAGLAKNPQNTSLLHFASRIAYALHDFDGAESYLMQAMDVPDAYDETIFLLSNLYLDHEEIDGVINLAPQIEDDNYLAKWNLARAYQIKEEDDKALQIYDDIYTYLFDDVEFVLAYIDALTNAGRRQEARDIAENFIQQVEFDDRIQSKLIGLMED
jgi:tetratricopeptide (TPR) repeat protein